MHETISVIFGRNINEKVRNQKMLCFPTTCLVHMQSIVKREIRKHIFTYTLYVALLTNTQNAFK